jgi:2-C-methyl-D-erythritol 4-phosphate cytidylyltransferase/2-C-methyl-D-erythritol 2,4-cyclodiphosphate synthase
MQAAGLNSPKQYAPMPDGRPMLRHSAEALQQAGLAPLVVVVHPEWQSAAEEALAGMQPRPILVHGGARRQDSVRAGLEALAHQADAPEWVLIHDAARPFLSARLITALLARLGDAEAVIPVLAVRDTVKQLADDGVVEATLPRQKIGLAQTPQAFHLQKILAAHRECEASVEMTDDAAIAEACGLRVQTIAGEAANRKITTPEDWPVMHPAPMEYRSASGFDCHRLHPSTERPLMLGGIEVPCGLALEGHSDADVLLHALTDAVLGTVGLGDIGQHFSPKDARWKDAASAQFLAHAVALAAEQGAKLVHVDVTLIGEEPKLAPHREAMRQSIARITGLDVARVSLKATTTEGMGFTGRGEGLAAQAMATVCLPVGE